MIDLFALTLSAAKDRDEMNDKRTYEQHEDYTLFQREKRNIQLKPRARKSQPIRQRGQNTALCSLMQCSAELLES